MPLGKIRSRARFYRARIQYTTAAWLAFHLPRAVMLSCVRTVGFFAPIFTPKKRFVVALQLEKVIGRPATDAEIRATYASYVRYWFDAFRTPKVSPEESLAFMAVEGYNHIDEALAAGRGIIFALPHIGNWDVAGAWLIANGVPLTVVAEALDPPEMFEWFANFRSSFGLKVVSNGPRVGSTLLEALRKNEAIALLSDRDVDQTGGHFEFFGEDATVPKGPATLALRSGAALLPVAVYEDGHSYRVQILAPIEAVRHGKLSEDVDRVTQTLVHNFEKLISVAPEQWHVFNPNWPSVAELVKKR